MNKRKIFSLLLLMACALPAMNLRADDSAPAATVTNGKEDLPVYDLPEEMTFNLQKNNAYLGQRISDAIFDGIHNLHIYKFSTDRQSIGLQIGRSIFDNHDILQSYTVVDTFKIPVTLFGWSMPIGATPFSLNFNIGGDNTFTDLRIVTKGGFANLDTIDDRVTNIVSSDWYHNVTTVSNSSDDATASPSPSPSPLVSPAPSASPSPSASPEPEPSASPSPDNPPYADAPVINSNPLLKLDSLDSARYGKFWNQLSFVARLPLRAEWINHIDVGEIITYGADGYAEFGPSVGIDTSSIHVDHFFDGLNASIGTRFFVRGNYQIAILREDENHVKLKVTRSTSAGANLSVGGGADEARIFDGFALFGKDDIARIKVSIVPFNFFDEESVGSSLEQGFRFDLRDANAAAAYNKAVRGQLGDADDLAVSLAGQTDAAVQKLFVRDSIDHNDTETHNLKVIFYSRDHNSTTVNHDGDLTLPDGKHKIYEGIVENHYDSKFFLGERDSVVTRTTIDFDDNVSDIVLEGWVDDSLTRGHDLLAYEATIEKVIDRGQIFPYLPGTFPDHVSDDGSDEDSSSPEEKKALEADYGLSSFYFRIDASQEQVTKFMHVADADKWKVLERVFDVTDGAWESEAARKSLRFGSNFGRFINYIFSPFDIHFSSIEKMAVADSIHDNWASLDTMTDPKEITSTLSKQFASTIYGLPMMQTFTNAIGGKNLPFYLTATNLSFGRVSVQEGEFSKTGQTLEEYRRTVNFDNPEPGQNINLSIDGFKLKVIDENQVQLTFNVKTKPQFIYFRVVQESFFNHDKAELIALNLGQVDVGANTLTFDKREKNYGGEIAKSILSESSTYELYMSLGAAKRDWGPVSSTKVFSQFGN